MNRSKCPVCEKGELMATSEGFGETWKTYSCGHEKESKDKIEESEL